MTVSPASIFVSEAGVMLVLEGRTVDGFEQHFELPGPRSADVAAFGRSEGLWEMWFLLSCGQRALLRPPHQTNSFWYVHTYTSVLTSISASRRARWNQ